ncbi:MAG: hypothetical protein ACXVIB_06155 [Halobacteriota archaeon]
MTLMYPGMISDTGNKNFVASRYTPVQWSSSAFVTLPLIFCTLPVIGGILFERKRDVGIVKIGALYDYDPFDMVCAQLSEVLFILPAEEVKNPVKRCLYLDR